MHTIHICGICGEAMEVCEFCQGKACSDGCPDRISDGCVCMDLDEFAG